jgi:hypothetical protein
MRINDTHLAKKLPESLQQDGSQQLITSPCLEAAD